MTEQEFINLYKNNLDKVFRFIYFRVDKIEIAQDLTAQVFLKVWQRQIPVIASEAKQSPAISNPTAFIFRVARNQIIDFYRQKNKTSVSLEKLKEKGVDLPQRSFISQIELSFEIENLKKSLQRIKPAYSEVIIWHYVDDLSTKEIAQILNKNENNVRVLLHRALEALKKEVNPHTITGLKDSLKP
jgi:RNA polymerase sigma-70 factor (ECF subfamily)